MRFIASFLVIADHSEAQIFRYEIDQLSFGNSLYLLAWTRFREDQPALTPQNGYQATLQDITIEESDNLSPEVFAKVMELDTQIGIISRQIRINSLWLPLGVLIAFMVGFFAHALFS